MSRIILAGVDGTETALKAAEKAATLAVALEAELHILSAFSLSLAETIQSAQTTDNPAAMADAVRDLLVHHATEAEHTASAVAEKLRTNFPELRISQKAVEGTPGAALASEARSSRSDMIVVGNKRVEGAAKGLGSIARTVASEANCDLYIVHMQRLG